MKILYNIKPYTLELTYETFTPQACQYTLLCWDKTGKILQDFPVKQAEFVYPKQVDKYEFWDILKHVQALFTLHKKKHPSTF